MSTAPAESDRLRRARELARLTQEQLAHYAGCNQATVWRHETGRTPLSTHSRRKYAHVLCCSEQWLQYGTGIGPVHSYPRVVDEFLADPFGKNVPEDVAHLLRTFPWESLGLAQVTLQVVEQLCTIMESNRGAVRDSCDGRRTRRAESRSEHVSQSA